MFLSLEDSWRILLHSNNSDLSKVNMTGIIIPLIQQTSFNNPGGTEKYLYLFIIISVSFVYTKFF